MGSSQSTQTGTSHSDKQRSLEAPAPSLSGRKTFESKGFAEANGSKTTGSASNEPHVVRVEEDDDSSESEEESILDDDEEEERHLILEDARKLKQLAGFYLHPESPVQVDGTAGARSFFSRPSADEQISEEEERRLILEEAAALKKLAVDYQHPELPVVTSDPTIFGRNYYSRASAEEHVSEDDAEERAHILQEAAALKKLAVDYQQPQLPVEVDSTAFGRNYYSRPSAEEQMSEEDEEERAHILQEAAALKKLAVDYQQPQLPVEVDSTAFGRNYYSRPSAPGPHEHIHSMGADDEDYGFHHDDHFEMDEDVFSDMRENLILPGIDKSTGAVDKIEGSEEEEGKLSRSPSSVMLFEEAI